MMRVKCHVSLLEETGVPGGNHRPTVRQLVGMKIKRYSKHGNSASWGCGSEGGRWVPQQSSDGPR